jgi:hypothetical protein
VKKYLLIDVFERDIGLPQVFDTAEAAMSAMVEAVAETLRMEPGAILRALQESESYTAEDVCEVHKTYAWANTSKGCLDVIVAELDTET